LRLGRAARKQLDELIASAAPLRGDFFRSVAFHYFHPDDVVSGEGTRLNGGRFAPVGVKAVYASFEEETATREVNVRKRALGGRSQISVGEGVVLILDSDLRQREQPSVVGEALIR